MNVSTGFERIRNDSQLQDHWIRRLVAFIIDSMIVGVLTLVIAIIIVIPLVLMALIAGLPRYVTDPLSFPFFAGILSILYFTLMETYYGTTLGKSMMNLRTVGLDGQKPTLDLALMRNVSKIYWAIVLLDTIVGLATLGDPRQKATDRIAGTIVVSKGASVLTKTITPQPSAGACPNCGKMTPAGAEYCPHCGKKLR